MRLPPGDITLLYVGHPVTEPYLLIPDYTPI